VASEFRYAGEVTLVIRTVRVTGFGVGLGVGLGVGFGVGLGVGFGVDFEVGIVVGATLPVAGGADRRSEPFGPPGAVGDRFP
jgi:hypothetical protein